MANGQAISVWKHWRRLSESLFAPSVTVNGVKVGEELAVTKVGAVKENEKLRTGPLRAV